MADLDPFRDDPRETDDEADLRWARWRIAQLETLVREVKAHRVGDMPREGYLRDTDDSRLALQRLFNAVLPKSFS